MQARKTQESKAAISPHTRTMKSIKKTPNETYISSEAFLLMSTNVVANTCSKIYKKE
jgi:hypothetical protein